MTNSFRLMSVFPCGAIR